MIAEFCSWCNEYFRNKECKECAGCLECPHFKKGTCRNEFVVAGYREEWDRPDIVVGIGPPLCRTYCPYLSPAEKQRADSCHHPL